VSCEAHHQLPTGQTFRLGLKVVKDKDALRSEYSKLKKQAREYGIMKRNMESILGAPEGKGRAKSRSAGCP
jgi:hypothetical protein